jgi:hypothetical protein
VGHDIDRGQLVGAVGERADDRLAEGATEEERGDGELDAAEMKIAIQIQADPGIVGFLEMCFDMRFDLLA